MTHLNGFTDVLRLTAILSTLLYLTLVVVLVLPYQRKLIFSEKINFGASIFLALGTAIIDIFVISRRVPATLTSLLQPIVAIFFLARSFAIYHYDRYVLSADDLVDNNSQNRREGNYG